MLLVVISFESLLLLSISLQGGCFDDFLSHLMCCCCALVQELREVELRGVHGILNELDKFIEILELIDM